MRLKTSSSKQKLRGAYYTPRNLASAIVRFSEADNAKAILEPSCGDGVFLEALADYRSLGSEVSVDAVEIDRDALLAASNVPMGGAATRMLNSDFFDFYEDSEPGSYDLILGNPPYIRYQYLSQEQRVLLSDILQRQGMKSNRLINSWVGFMVACTDLLADGGTLSFVVPAEILQVAYAEDLRKFLAGHYKAITLFTFNKLVFDDAEQETVVFIGKKGNGHGLIRVVEFENIADMDNWESDSIPYQPLETTNEKWTRYFMSAQDASALSGLEKDERLVRFSSLATVNVGVTTGNNAFFSITDEVSSRYDLDDLTLPLIGRSSHASGVFFTEDDWLGNRRGGKRARLLVLDDGQYNDLNKVQQAYIDYGEESGESRGYKCSIRNSWYSVPSIWIPDAFLLRRNNLYPKFVLNQCGAISTDTMHRIKFNPGVDPDLALVSYYNSITFASTELCGRSYGGGVLEILPKEASNIIVLNPTLLDLDAQTKRELLEMLDHAVRFGSDIEAALDVIDEKVLVQHLGFSRSLCTTCRRVWKRLQKRRLDRSV